MNKRHLLKIACAKANMSIKDFAKQNNVTDTAIHHLLSGKIKSKNLETAVNTFINYQLKNIKITNLPSLNERTNHAA